MDNWLISDTVDLSIPGMPRICPEALMVPGDDHAHTWEITLRNAGRPANLEGASAEAYFNRADNVAVPVKGEISGSTVRVTLTGACYIVPGPLVGIFRLTTSDGYVLTISVTRFTVTGGVHSSIVDEEHIVPNLEQLLEQIAAMEEAAKDADSAAQRAHSAAEEAEEARQSIQADLAQLSYEMPQIGQGQEHILLEASDVDASLSVSGAPADAAAVGARLQEIAVLISSLQHE